MIKKKVGSFYFLEFTFFFTSGCSKVILWMILADVSQELVYNQLRNNTIPSKTIYNYIWRTFPLSS